MKSSTKTISAICAAAALSLLSAMPASAAGQESTVGHAVGVSAASLSLAQAPKTASASDASVSPNAQAAKVRPESTVTTQKSAASSTRSGEASTSPAASPATPAAEAEVPTPSASNAGTTAATPSPVTAPVAASAPAPAPTTAATPLAPHEGTPTSCEWEGYVLDSYSENCAAQKQAAIASISVNPDLGPAVSLENNFDGTYKVWANGVQIAPASTDGEDDVIQVLFQISRDHAKA